MDSFKRRYLPSENEDLGIQMNQPSEIQEVSSYQEEDMGQVSKQKSANLRDYMNEEYI